MFSNFLTWVFFGDIRIIEQKVSGWKSNDLFVDIVRYGQISEEDLLVLAVIDRTSKHLRYLQNARACDTVLFLRDSLARQ